MASTKTGIRRRALPSSTSKAGGTGWRTWIGVAGGVVVLLALFAVMAGNDDSGNGAATNGGGEGLAHVHGLGINPADGTLYAASHYGLFRIPEQGDAQRVGDAVQDTMGFTVVGSDHFLASGHPDLRDERLNQPGKPPLLGLIESTNAGRTWSPLSLLGEADFHFLTAAHGAVYGYDSTNGRLMVSPDGKEWQTRSHLRMGDFAVDPAEADHLVAMTEQGLAESTDGGRSWTGIDGPQLAFLSWHESRGLWGVTPEGQTYVRKGESWDPGGALPGLPQELLVTEDPFYAAVDEGESTGIYVSTDEGETWTLRYADRQP